MTDMTVSLGPLHMRSPLVAAAGTVGSVYDFADVDALGVYGAAVAKSVSHDPWPGRPAPRIAPAGIGMLNGIGIQNPGIDEWRTAMPDLSTLPVPVWGSAVGSDAAEFALVAKGLAAAGVEAVEVNLSCPNLEEGTMFALNPAAAAKVVSAVRASTHLPLGAKLSPNSEDIVSIARAVTEVGADFVVLTNTVWGMGVDLETRLPKLSGVIGGFSGPPLKPIALRCVWEVAAALDVPIVGCGGIRTGEDVIEYFLAGASAVAIGSAHFAEPRIGRRILRQADAWCRREGTAAHARVDRRSPPEVSERILVALDLPTAEDAVRLARAVAPHVGGFKVGLGLLFGPGPATVAAVAEIGKPVFVDAKLHDIPSQVERAARRLAALGARWITVHASGGVPMLEGGVAGATAAGTGSGVLAVTVLTSMTDADVERLAPGSTAGKLTSRLARSAQQAGCEGVICSGRELGVIAQVAPELLKVTPGIRLPGTDEGDQERTMSPVEAISRGSDYLVIGRPITSAKDPVAAAAVIAEAVES